MTCGVYEISDLLLNVRSERADENFDDVTGKPKHKRRVRNYCVKRYLPSQTRILITFQSIGIPIILLLFGPA